MKKHDCTFIDPNGRNKAEITNTFNNALAMLIDFLSSANKQQLLPPLEKLQSFSFKLPEEALPETDMKKELESIISMSMNSANSSYIGHMDSLPSTYSIIGSLYSAALNNNQFSLEMSPYFTRADASKY
jgi:glutamate/tyrosine decarboxylase-like PLP-dependent enzyme